MYNAYFEVAGNGRGVFGIDSLYRSLRRRAGLGQLLSYITGRPRSLRSLAEAMDGYRFCGQH